MRLFTAIAIPEHVQASLMALQPPPVTGLRLVAAHQFHLTLHFLGDMDFETVSTALARVKAAPFPVTLRGTGFFSGRDRAVTLWAGAASGDALHNLHATLTKLLLPTGFKPESRPYSPHVTLARCAAAVPHRVVSDFVVSHAQAEPGTWMVHSLGLWSSTLDADSPVYRLEKEFPLT